MHIQATGSCRSLDSVLLLVIAHTGILPFDQWNRPYAAYGVRWLFYENVKGLGENLRNLADRP